MLIDWFTIIAQALNFLILAWLLKRFLYRPVLNALDEREKLIASELADAAEKEAEAQKEREELKRKNEEIDQQRIALLNKAREEANLERSRLLEAARKAATDLNLKLQENLRNDRRSLNQAIRKRTQQEIFAISRKALAELADSSLEERMVRKFIQKLQRLSKEEKAQLLSGFNSSFNSLSTSSNTALIRSAFELPDSQRTDFEKIIKETFGKEVQTKFETSADLVSGIELILNGQKMAWSIEDYLAALEKSIDELVTQQIRSETQTEPEIKPEIKPEPGSGFDESDSGSTTAGSDFVKTELKSGPEPKKPDQE
ncbi:MAG: F0F1 ATP synthase subunit B [Methanosarcina sp.]